LEYLEALIRSCEDGRLVEEPARLAVQREIQEFEQKKARALRRQRPRKTQGTRTLTECLTLAVHLGLIDPRKHLRPKAAQVVDPGQRRHTLLESIWQVYPRFAQVVMTVRDAGELELPFYDWDGYRKRGGDLRGLNMDRRNFEINRDFATQLGLVNWYPSEKSRQIVYSAACVATQSEILGMVGGPAEQEGLRHQCLDRIALETNLLAIEGDRYRLEDESGSIPPDYLVLQTMTDRVFIRDHSVDSATFEQALWGQYLKLADMIPMSPVLYPSLRDQVCVVLRISDQLFDRQLIGLIQSPHRLNVYPSDGILNYAANLAHIGKFLPPQTSEGNFIVYLKMERRNAE
jgi:hypothetical protein